MVQKDDRGRNERGLRKKAGVLALAFALIGLLLGALFGDRGLLQLLERREQAEELRRDLDNLRAENARLASAIKDLRTSPRATERLAREQLGLARPGETVFLLRDEPAPERP